MHTWRLLLLRPSLCFKMNDLNSSLVSSGPVFVSNSGQYAQTDICSLCVIMFFENGRKVYLELVSYTENLWNLVHMIITDLADMQKAIHTLSYAQKCTIILYWCDSAQNHITHLNNKLSLTDFSLQRADLQILPFMGSKTHKSAQVCKVTLSKPKRECVMSRWDNIVLTEYATRFMLRNTFVAQEMPSKPIWGTYYVASNF